MNSIILFLSLQTLQIYQLVNQNKKKGVGYTVISPEKWSQIVEESFVFGNQHVLSKYNIKESTLYQKIKKYGISRDENAFAPLKRGSPAGIKKQKKISGELSDFLIKEFKEDITQSGRKLALKLKEEAKKINPEADFNVSITTVNKFLKEKQYTCKISRKEEVERNSPTLIDERHLFSKFLLDNGYRNKGARVIYYGFIYMESNIIARKARSLIGTPSVFSRAHRGIYINKDPKTMNQKNKGTSQNLDANQNKKAQENQESNQEDDEENQEYENFNGIICSKSDPVVTDKGRVNSIALCVAITSESVLLAQTQFRRFANIDFYQFMVKLLEKLEKEYPGESFTFVGDNERVYNLGIELLLKDQYKHHNYIPNPRYSPFLNAVEYLFNQIKSSVACQKHKKIGDLVTSVQESFKKVQPGNLANYHETANYFLLKCLQKEEVHAWRTTLFNKVKVPLDSPDQTWEVFHKLVFTMEQNFLNKLLVESVPEKPVKSAKQVLIINGQTMQLYQGQAVNESIHF
ncbi:hypothetical protein DLAC_10092 [Tieghemostelium lacteum]|uniref:Tc1-like transposase DDE domain-containing protein n=1 Tax=Tieghemostelium lacteum TaxID=361077 RepID=A0A151Z669_TIELA|nr:hypothetical protein DLAC_10092 [Tieghemostelium lacteum]|eukprot:KYQ89428.1 hypothetical protein DLAC_10092 [Tieghemostelium lacteum]